VLVYGQDVLLHIEVNLDAYGLPNYYFFTMGNIDEAKKCLKAYEEIEKDKAQVARAYNNEMNIIIGWRSDLEDNSTSHDEGQ